MTESVKHSRTGSANVGDQRWIDKLAAILFEPSGVSAENAAPEGIGFDLLWVGFKHDLNSILFADVLELRLICGPDVNCGRAPVTNASVADRKSTRLNS